MALRPDPVDQVFLDAWDSLKMLCPPLIDRLKKATTEKGQIKYADALKKVRISFLFIIY